MTSEPPSIRCSVRAVDPDPHQARFEAIRDSFEAHLRQICTAAGLFDLPAEPPGPANFDALCTAIASHSIDVGDFVRSVSLDNLLQRLSDHPQSGRTDGGRLIVGPCSILFTEVLEALPAHFPNLVFADNFRAGSHIGHTPIVALADLPPRPDDLCLILTRNTDAIASFKRHFEGAACLDWLDLYLQQARATLRASVPPFIDAIDRSQRPVLFASAKPLGTLAPTLEQLRQDGYTPFWFGAEDVRDSSQTGYSTPRVDDLALQGYAIGSLHDLLFTLCTLRQGAVLFHYESVYPPAWDFHRVALCYACCLAIIRTVRDQRLADSRARLILHLYDAIKPGVKNYAAGTACGQLYQQMMKEAEGVIFSSYTEAFGDFVENAIRQPLRRAHCHRYHKVPTVRLPKLEGGYHLAIISVMLEEFWEPSRSGLTSWLRDIIAQGIHIHYYVGAGSRDKASTFGDSLPAAQRHRFHLHAPIHSPQRLAVELSQYHVGWSLFNMQIFNAMTTRLDDQFTRDAMDLFTPTTLPSVIWSCAAAGLPVICNRSMRGVVDELPKGLSLPLCLSEIGNLRHILDKLDWDAIARIPLDTLDIAAHIHRLYHFLDGFDVFHTHD